MKKDRSVFAGKRVLVSWKNGSSPPGCSGNEGVVEDWWINVYGESWMNAVGNPAALIYAVRSASAGLPIDDEVLYMKISGLGYLVHLDEVSKVIEE